ncbi:MAG: hypothetical protein KKI06_08655 [Euryarchaeota archaeon]|nr:hypothetical protein [Euryarchaeota archaeon]
MLENYHIGDCVGHAEDVRIIKDELYCDNCRKFTGIVYIVVDRGILLGTAGTLDEARKLMDSLDMEHFVLFYHKLYERYLKERKEKHMYLRFLKNLREWYGEKLYEKPPNGFSEAVVVVAVKKWLEDRRYEFGVRMIEMEKARGSGLVKKLRERRE